MSKLKLLVVEDDEGLCRQYRWAFPDHEVLLAQTAQAARSIVSRESPPVAILDLGLPPDRDGVSEGMGLLRELLGAIPDAKIIGFPRGAGTELGRYLDAVAVDAIGLDWTVELGFARTEIQPRRPIQGNLDPLALLVGGAALDRSIDAIVAAFSPGPFIFNLGHGVLPDTPLRHVERLIARVRGVSLPD